MELFSNYNRLAIPVFCGNRYAITLYIVVCICHERYIYVNCLLEVIVSSKVRLPTIPLWLVVLPNDREAEKHMVAIALPYRSR